MKKSGRLTALLVAGALSVAPIVGCSATPGNTQAPETEREDITITYWENLIDDGGVQDAVIASFEAAHPGVKVNRVTLQLDDMTVKLPSSLGTRSGPDLVYADVSPQFLGDYVKSGRILDLTEAYRQRGWDERVYPWAIERATYDDKIYAVGHEVETLGLMYNKKAFERAGIAPPATLDELEAAMEKIKQTSDITPLTLACANGCYNGFHVMHTIAYATMPTAEVTSTTPQGDGNYTDPGWLNALQVFDRWNKAGYFTKDANGIDFDNHWASFCSGGTAMLTQGTWLFKTIEDCAKASGGALEWANMPFPVSSGLPFQAYVGIGSAWYAPSTLAEDAQKEAAVLDLIDALISPDAANQWVSDAQIFPAVPFDQAAVSLTDAQQSALDIIEKAGENGGPVPVGFNNSAEESKVWAEGLQGIIAGSMTPEQLIPELQAQLDKARKAWNA